MEIAIRNLFKVSVISIFNLYNNVFYLNTTVITDTLLILIMSIPWPKSIDVDSGIIEMKYLYTSWFSVADDEYCILKFTNYIITAIITTDHKICDIDSYISQLP